MTRDAMHREAMFAASAADTRTEIDLADSVNAYQDEALRFAFYPEIWRAPNGKTEELLPVYPAASMMGEVAEVCEKITDAVAAVHVIKELGDVLWYLAASARVLGYRLSQIADTVDWGSYADRVNLSKHTVEDWAMRLVTAAGRFWEQDVKKPWRDGSPLNRLIALGHMRDILRALAGIADEYGYTMGQVAQTNIDKLVERRQRGTLTGSGDNR